MRTINFIYAYIAEGSAMQTQINLAAGSETVRTLGMRASATPYRKEIERSLDTGYSVAIDFSGKDATQSFVDELIGGLILKRGRGVLSSLSFKNCPDDVKSIIKFVVNDRAHQLKTEQAVA
jgi:hypothetical protein